MSQCLKMVIAVLSSVFVAVAHGQSNPAVDEIHLQQQMIFQELGLPWDESDGVLVLGDAIFEDWQTTWATTTNNDAFQVENFCSAVFDWEDEDFLDQVALGGYGEWMTALQELDFEAALGMLRLESATGEVCYAFGLLYSADGASGVRFHHLILINLIELATGEAVRAGCYELDFEASDSSPCASLNRTDLNFDDPDFQACNAIARSNKACRRDKWKGQFTKCIGVGLISLGACALFPFTCWGGIGATLTCGSCMITETVNFMADFRNAKDCCCTSLACRTDGGQDCPTTSSCNESGCDPACSW